MNRGAFNTIYREVLGLMNEFPPICLLQKMGQGTWRIAQRSDGFSYVLKMEPRVLQYDNEDKIFFIDYRILFYPGEMTIPITVYNPSYSITDKLGSMKVFQDILADLRPYILQISQMVYDLGLFPVTRKYMEETKEFIEAKVKADMGIFLQDVIASLRDKFQHLYKSYESGNRFLFVKTPNMFANYYLEVRPYEEKGEDYILFLITQSDLVYQSIQVNVYGLSADEVIETAAVRLTSIKDALALLSNRYNIVLGSEKKKDKKEE